MGKNNQKLVAFAFGVAFVIALLVLAIAFPDPTPFQYTVFRVVLSLAAAGVGAIIPGLLEAKAATWIRASGALAVFVIVYFYSPAALVTPPPNGNTPEPNSPLVGESSETPVTPPQDANAPAPESPPIGSRVVLDISKGQDNWIGLTAWASDSPLEIRTLEDPFRAENSDDERPGVLIHALPYKELLSGPDIALMRGWVERGGGLLVLGYYAADTHHGSNVGKLVGQWGISFEDNLLMPPGASEDDTKGQVFGLDAKFGLEVDIPLDEYSPVTNGVNRLVVQSAASLNVKYPLLSKPLTFVVETGKQTGIWRPEGHKDRDGMRLDIDWTHEETESVPVLVGFEYGRGKVAICGTWKLATLNRADNGRLIRNLIEWLRPTSH
ncbi:MAG: hypothetical protein JSU70_02970 [Phycisphaerales bacterium]|nr:MAG: hypothetical protein JSU70_02970 [Phycisphaerales bacterium]